MSHKADVKILDQLCAYLESLGKTMSPSSFKILAEFSSLKMQDCNPICLLAVIWGLLPVPRSHPYSSHMAPAQNFKGSNRTPSPSHISTFSFFFCLFYLTQLGIFIILLNWIQSDNPGYYSHLSVLNHVCRGCWYHIR